MAENKLRLLTTNFVIDETLTLMRSRLGHAAAVQFGETLYASQLVTTLAVTAEDERRAFELFKRHDDQVWSFTDCTSFTVMRRLGLQAALSLDDDFRQARFRVLP